MRILPVCHLSLPQVFTLSVIVLEQFGMYIEDSSFIKLYNASRSTESDMTSSEAYIQKAAGFRSTQHSSSFVWFEHNEVQLGE